MILSWGSGVSGQALFVVYLDNEAARFSTTPTDKQYLPEYQNVLRFDKEAPSKG